MPRNDVLAKEPHRWGWSREIIVELNFLSEMEMCGSGGTVVLCQEQYLGVWR